MVPASGLMHRHLMSPHLTFSMLSLHSRPRLQFLLVLTLIAAAMAIAGPAETLADWHCTSYQPTANSCRRF